MRFGDTIRIEMKDGGGHSIFGAIEQEIVPMNDDASMLRIDHVQLTRFPRALRSNAGASTWTCSE